MNRRKFSQLAVGASIAGTFSLMDAQGATSSGASPLAPPVGTSSATGPVRFSVMVWTLEKQAPFDRCLEIVAEAGYQGVELTGQFKKWTPAETERILTKIRGLGLVVDLLSGVKPLFADPNASAEFLAALTDQLKFSKVLASPQINLRSGKRIDSMARNVQHAAAVENLRRAADLAAAAGVELVIESIDPIESPSEYLTTVTEGFEIVREVASPHVKVLYDFYHEQRAYGNLIEKLEQNIDLVGLVHIADVPGRHEPGTGEINYTNIYRKLAELKYSRFVTMEFYPIGEPVAALKKARLEAIAAMGLG